MIRWAKSSLRRVTYIFALLYVGLDTRPGADHKSPSMDYKYRNRKIDPNCLSARAHTVLGCGAHSFAGARLIAPLKDSRFPKVYCAVLCGFAVALQLTLTNVVYYHRLAASFIEGKLSVLLPAEQALDLAPFQGHWYYTDGPLPSIIMIPFVAAGYFIEQGLLVLLANSGIFYLCFKLAKHFEYSDADALWLSLAFCFGTSFAAVALIPWSIVHAIVVLFLFLAIAEYENKRRLPLIGFYLGLAAMTRVPAGLNIFFFALAIVAGDWSSREKAASLTKLAIGFAPCVLFLALYNFARFGDPLESGYSYQVVKFGLAYSDVNAPGFHRGAVLSLFHIPRNLMVFAFGLPESRGVGTSVFLISPFFIYLASMRKWDIVNTLLAIDISLVLFAVLSFRSTGLNQMGYRFSLDFLPFVYWLAVRSEFKLTQGFKNLVFVSTLIDIGLVGYYLHTRPH